MTAKIGKMTIITGEKKRNLEIILKYAKGKKVSQKRKLMGCKEKSKPRIIN